MQARYFSKEERSKKEAEAMRLYETCGEHFRTNVETYKKLLNQKSENGLPIKRAERLSAEMLDGYPKIPFLEAKNSTAAQALLDDMRDIEVEALIETIEDLPTDYVYRRVSGLIIDFRHQLNSRGARKSVYAAGAECRKVHYGRAY